MIKMNIIRGEDISQNKGKRSVLAEKGVKRVFRRFKIKRYNREEDCIEIDYIELKERVRTGAILLDVRSAQEYQEGHLEGAILVPEYEIEKNIERMISNKHQEIIVYCTSGSRSKKACKTMKQKGYNNLYNLKGGIDNI